MFGRFWSFFPQHWSVFEPRCSNRTDQNRTWREWNVKRTSRSIYGSLLYIWWHGRPRCVLACQKRVCNKNKIPSKGVAKCIAPPEQELDLIFRPGSTTSYGKRKSDNLYDVPPPLLQRGLVTRKTSNLSILHRTTVMRASRTQYLRTPERPKRNEHHSYFQASLSSKHCWTWDCFSQCHWSFSSCNVECSRGRSRWYVSFVVRAWSSQPFASNYVASHSNYSWIFVLALEVKKSLC